MSIYTQKEIVNQNNTITKTNFIESTEFYINKIHYIINRYKFCYIKILKKDAILLQWIEQHIDSLYPNNKLTIYGKIYLILNPLINLKCPYGNEKRYSKQDRKLFCPRSCQCVKDEKIKTNLKKYGVSSSNQAASVKQKKKKTLLDTNRRIGIAQLKINRKISQIKAQTTNLIRFGYLHAMQNQTVQDKCISTTQKRYGMKYTGQVQQFIEKRKRTNRKRYGVSNISQRHIKVAHRSILNNKNKFSELLKINSVPAIARYLGVSDSTILNYHKKYKLNILNKNISSSEKRIRKCCLDAR